MGKSEGMRLDISEQIYEDLVRAVWTYCLDRYSPACPDLLRWVVKEKIKQAKAEWEPANGSHSPDPCKGFSVYNEYFERFLSDEEIELAHLYVSHEGELLRFEPFIQKVGGKPDIIFYSRTPKNLHLMRRGVGQERERNK